MINSLNKKIDIDALESRLAEELEEKIEFGCYALNCGCDHLCGANVSPCACNANRPRPVLHC